MADRDTIAALAEALASMLEPLLLALESPDDFTGFMDDLGWTMTAIPQPLADISPPLSVVQDLVSDGEIDLATAPALIQAIRTALEAVERIKSQPASAFPASVDGAAFANEFPRQVLDHLIATYLLQQQDRLAQLLKLSGVVRVEAVSPAGLRPGYVRRSIAWTDLGRVLNEPGATFRGAYQWGTAAFAHEAFLADLANLARAWGLDAVFDWPQAELRTFLVAGAPALEDVHEYLLRAPLLKEDIGFADIEAGIAVSAFPATDAAPPGFAVLPYARGTAEQRISLSDRVELVFEGGFNVQGGVSVLVRPGRPVEVVVDIIDSIARGAVPGVAARIAARLAVRPTPGDKTLLLIGSREGSRLELRSASAAGGVRVNSAGKADAFVEANLERAHLVVRPGPGQADSFLESLLPAQGIELSTDVLVGLSTSQGFYFGGSGGLEVELPAHVRLGPIEVTSATLTVKPDANGIPFEIGATLNGELGPLAASIQNVGLCAVLRFPGGNAGNLGPLDVALSFKPPNGVGLALDTGIIKGGGFLYLDPDRGEYAGALEVTFSDAIALKAIGLITTKMPDGSTGFSLLIIITAEFGEGIQLGFGFTLLAVGGLIGLNRTMRLQPLLEGVRTGAINSIMFPQDVVANAPKILSDLRAFFPPQEGTFLIGPMAKLGWGTPTLISLSLGIIIEVPGDIAILGVLRVVLPADDVAILVLQVNFVGAIEFDKERMYFFAALFESRILFISIEGEMGLLLALGADANFVVSVGGFHPRFNPPPLPFPNPKRVSVSLVNTQIARVRIDGYFAVTSNTVQFGAHAEAFFGYDEINVHGDLAFDALFQFSPFYFIIQISASFSVDVLGLGLFGVGIRGSLEGPTPWRVNGEGSISLLFFDISVPVHVKWGETRDTTLPPIAVMPLFTEEFKKEENWRALLPPTSNLLVTLRRLASGDTALVLHPVGVLQVSQRLVPLELLLDRVGTQKPSDVNRLSVEVAGGGLAKQADALEQFALAQFQDMSDADKLSRPAFTPEPGGLYLSAAGQQLSSSRMVKRTVRYEQIIIDTNFKRFARRFVRFPVVLFELFLKRAAVARSDLATARKKQFQPFDETITVQAETYSVVFQSTNKAYAADSVSFASEASARDYLARQASKDPNLQGALQVVPAYERAS